MKDPFERCATLALVGIALLPYEVHLTVTTVGRIWLISPPGRLVAIYLWILTGVALVSAVAAASLVARNRFLVAFLAIGLVVLNTLLFLGTGCVACAKSVP